MVVEGVRGLAGAALVEPREPDLWFGGGRPGVGLVAVQRVERVERL